MSALAAPALNCIHSRLEMVKWWEELFFAFRRPIWRVLMDLNPQTCSPALRPYVFTCAYVRARRQTRETRITCSVTFTAINPCRSPSSSSLVRPAFAQPAFFFYSSSSAQSCSFAIAVAAPVHRIWPLTYTDRPSSHRGLRLPLLDS